jgi:predicted RNA polymerase sigma factor
VTIGPEPFPGEHLLRDLAPQVLGAGMRRFGDFAAAEDAVQEALIAAARQCHPALSRSSAIALTLRAVGGLTTAEIAGAFLVPEATMAQRISRAKQRIRSSGVPFRLPTLRQAQVAPSTVERRPPTSARSGWARCCTCSI